MSTTVISAPAGYSRVVVLDIDGEIVTDEEPVIGFRVDIDDGMACVWPITVCGDWRDAGDNFWGTKTPDGAVYRGEMLYVNLEDFVGEFCKRRKMPTGKREARVDSPVMLQSSIITWLLKEDAEKLDLAPVD